MKTTIELFKLRSHQSSVYILLCVQDLLISGKEFLSLENKSLAGLPCSVLSAMLYNQTDKIMNNNIVCMECRHTLAVIQSPNLWTNYVN